MLNVTRLYGEGCSLLKKDHENFKRAYKLIAIAKPCVNLCLFCEDLDEKRHQQVTTIGLLKNIDKNIRWLADKVSSAGYVLEQSLQATLDIDQLNPFDLK